MWSDNSDATSGKISIISKCFFFIEASRNLISTFRDNEDAKKFKNHQHLYRKY